VNPLCLKKNEKNGSFFPIKLLGVSISGRTAANPAAAETTSSAPAAYAAAVPPRKWVKDVI
jgi:hypothetical protein